MRDFVRWTVAGAAQAGYERGPKPDAHSFCFPFNCADERRRGHQRRYCGRRALYNPSESLAIFTTKRTMATVEDLAERVERLLLRHEELGRTAALFEKQLADVTHERDSLRSRLNAARSRIDALLERLPAEPAANKSKGATP